MRRPPPQPLRWLTAAVLLGVAFPAAGTAYSEGEEIQFTGLVVDAAGRPVPQATVLLEAFRVQWSFHGLNRADRGRVAVDGVTRRVQTDDAGRFTLDWTWHDYYNRFELAAGVMLREPGGERFRELARVDLGRRVDEGSPVVTTLTIADAALVAAAHAFAAALETNDERRVYEQLGQPEQVATFERPDYQETTWWYFRLGKAYRFEDGRLVQVVPFDPVEPF
jgi:hypothetical protein